MRKIKPYRFPFASYPAIRLALLLAAGITLDFQLDTDPVLWIGLFSSLSICYGIVEIRHRRHLKIHYYHATLILYLLSVVAFGGTWHALFNRQDPPKAAEVLRAWIWEDLSFSGEVYRIKPTGSGKYQIDIVVDSTLFPGGTAWQETYNMRAVLNPEELPLPPHLGLGDRMYFSATVYPLDEPTNPHEFNYKAYLASQKIYLQGGITSITGFQKQNLFFSWSRIRQSVLSAIERMFRPQAAPLAKALLIGDKNELSRDVKLAFSRTGLSHIMAVSGLHAGFIIAPFWLIIPFFWGSKNGRRLGLVILILMLFFYAGLTGFSASVTRASLTGGLLVYARLYHKVRDAKNLTAVAALIILLLNPADLFSIGFQLSFGAVYIILLVAPVVSRIIPGRIRFRWYGAPVMAVIISLIVQAGLFPLLGWYFGEFSLAGPLANALVVPFLAIAVPCALLLVPLAVLWPGAAQVLNMPVDYFLLILNRFVMEAAGWQWSWIKVHIDNMMLFAIWAAVIFFIASLRIPRVRWKMLAAGLLLLAAAQAQKLFYTLNSPVLELTVFDVGQGDATHIRTAGGKHYLVDTGQWQPGYNSARYIIIPYLNAEGITRLDGVFLSHPHADHIGGIVELLQAVPIDTIYNSGSRYESNLFYNYQALAARKNTPVVSLERGRQLLPDPFTRFYVYGPEAGSADGSNVNNRSLVLELVYGDTEFLFMGDAEEKQETSLARQFPRLIDTDFLKVGHHGSKTSSTFPFLKAASPAVGVTSLSLRNRFGHPHKEAIARLRSDSLQLHFTSLNGALQLQSDGRRIIVKN